MKMKKMFDIPRIVPAVILTNPIGYGSDQEEQNKIKPVPMSFGEWAQSRFVSDYDQNPGVDFQDYAAWFSQCGFGETAWMQFNPGVTMDVSETK